MKNKLVTNKIRRRSSGLMEKRQSSWRLKVTNKNIKSGID